MLPLLLFVSSLVLRESQSLETNVTYDLHYYTQNELCAGAAPSVELAARDKRNGSSGFGDWYLLRYHTGNCSSNKVSSGRLLLEEGSELQLRLELSSGPPCYCISLSDNFTFSTGLLVNSSELFCGVSFLCGTGNSTYHLSRVITVTNGMLALSADCSSSSETVSGASDRAAVFAQSFGGTCPESEEACFALQPLGNNSRVKITHKIATNFEGDCRSLDMGNEGVLLTAEMDNAEVFPIGFYRSTTMLTDVTEDGIDVYPKIVNEENDTLELTYSDGTVFVVSGTLQEQFPNSFVAHSFETDKLLYNSVRFNFSQFFVSKMSNCDIWALESVQVAVEHGDCSRVRLENNFNGSSNVDGWQIYQAMFSQGTTNCTDDHTSCLYFTGWEGMRQLASRYATTPTLDLRVLAAVYPPKWSTVGITNCTAGEKLVELSFLLRPINFRQPSPCTDSTPNGIDLSVDANEAGLWKPLVYYAPVANKYWPELNISELNITELTLAVDSTHIPIQAPSTSGKTEVNFCAPGNASSLSFRWRQMNYGPEMTDQWILGDVEIRVEDVVFQEEVDSPLWTLTNGMHNVSSSCFSDLPPTAKFFAGTNTSFPRQAVLNMAPITAQTPSTSPAPVVPFSVTTTISSTVSSSSSSTPIPSPSPSPSICPAEGDTWPATAVGTSRNGSCGEGSMEVTRRCLSNGTWESLDCQSSSLFTSLLDQIMSSPEVGLQLLQQELTSMEAGLTSYQVAVLFSEVYLSLFPNVASIEFSQEFFAVASQLLNSQQDISDTSDEERRELGSLLLLTLDDFALNSINSSTASISTENIELYVQEVLQPVDPVVGIQVEGNNSIVLPIDIFTTNRSVRVASLFFRNLSLLLLPNEPNTSVVSPVISSTTDCNECRTQQLETNVTITFTLTQENLPREGYDDSLSCAFWEFAEVGEEDPPTGSWSRSGCDMTSREGTVIVCECNHLTHFAILLSPGVELSPEQAEILTILGYVLIPFSLLGLLLTMSVYIAFRSLWNMRSYIHIMLCGSMFAAQLTFVVGVNQTDDEDLCSAISVLLLYLFLVMFMWMLMEGVVLYVALVKVFVKHNKRYIAGFTSFSFGIPLLYMAVVVPVGFTVNGGNNFLYIDENGTLQACWLNPSSHFIWAFISPVIAIIITNVGFLVMSVMIMYHHQKRQTDKSNIAKARHWIKVIISLVLLMGIGWALNIVVFTEELLFVAYLSAVFIASQGIGIFLLFVVFSKKARQAVTKSVRIRAAGSDFWSKILPSTKSTYKTNSSKSFEGKNGPNNFHLNGMGTFGEAGSVGVNESVDSVNGRTLLREEEEGKNVHANIYVLSDVVTAGSLNPPDNKLDISASETQSGPSSAYEEQIEFMQF